MDDRTSRLATALAETFDVGPGDRVAVLANNNSNFFEVEFACWKLGAIFVPLNWRLALAELEFIVGDCTPTVMIVDDDFLESGVALGNSTGIAHLINWDGGSDLAADYEDAIVSASPLTRSVETTHDTPLTIMYTSGTTGSPKGAIITHGMVFFNAVNCVEYFVVATDMVNLTFLPLFHIAGLNTFANPAYHFGGTNIVMRTFDPAACLDLISDPSMASPTSSASPPTTCS
jgi:fatty-acyl-CoA synthase